MAKSERKKSSPVRKSTTCRMYIFKKFCKCNIEESDSKEKNEVLYVRKDPDMMQIHKKELDKKFTTDTHKYRKKKLVVETNSGECENSRASSQQLKSLHLLSYAEVTKTGQIEKEPIRN